MSKHILIALFLLGLVACSKQPLPSGAYSVEYKPPCGYFWSTIENVKGDGIMFGQNGQVVPVRYFILIDESRVEIPMTMMFKFDNGRFKAIEASIRRESGR
jgi:hypothetical protein